MFGFLEENTGHSSELVLYGSKDANAKRNVKEDGSVELGKSMFRRLYINGVIYFQK